MEQIVIKTFLHKYEAEMAKGLLDQVKIHSMILSDDCGEARTSLVFGEAVKLVVRKEDVERAQKILQVLESKVESEMDIVPIKTLEMSNIKNTEETIETRGLTTGSIFKLVFMGIACTYCLLGIFFLSCLLFVQGPIMFNGHPVNKIVFLVESCLTLPFVIIFHTITTWIILVVGQFVYTKKRTLRLTYKTVPSDVDLKRLKS